MVPIIVSLLRIDWLLNVPDCHGRDLHSFRLVLGIFEYLAWLFRIVDDLFWLNRSPGMIHSPPTVPCRQYTIQYVLSLGVKQEGQVDPVTLIWDLLNHTITHVSLAARQGWVCVKGHIRNSCQP